MSVTVYVKSFEGENFRGSSLKFNMYGKPFRLRALQIPKQSQIHTRDSSVYGVLELEDSRFNTCAMAEKQENSKLIVLSAVSMCVGHR